MHNRRLPKSNCDGNLTPSKRDLHELRNLLRERELQQQLDLVKREVSRIDESGSVAKVNHARTHRQRVLRGRPNGQSLNPALPAAKPASDAEKIAKVLELLDGHGTIVGHDGQFLGVISSYKSHQTSILNSYGPHGDKFSSTSIFNAFSQYGGEIGPYSPWNEITPTPPLIVVKGKFIAFLTINELNSRALIPRLVRPLS